MNDRSSQQIFNFDPRISSPSYHLSKGFDPRSLTNSPSSFNMSNSIHFTPNSSKLFEENNQNQMPNYNSLKIEQDKNKFIKKENTLSRQRSMNGYNMQKNYNGYDRKTMESESKHEHCLNWLEAGNSYEKESKVVDANIQLLMWKKRHLEILQKQKTKEKQSGGCQKLQDSSTTIASDSPPPLSDFFKPELSSVSADDGFESAVEAANNQVNLQHISYLEAELKRRDMKIQMYQELMAKKDLRNNYSKDLGFLTPQRTTFDLSSFKNYNNNTLDTSLQGLSSSPKTFVLPPDKSFFSDQPLNNYKTSTLDSKTPVRPTSFKTDLLPLQNSRTLGSRNIKSSLSSHDFSQSSYKQDNHFNNNNPHFTTKNNHNLTSQSHHNLTPQNHHNLSTQNHHNLSKEARVGSGSMELLKLKSELLVKDQHLRKMRSALKELSGRYNELLEQHMKLVQSQDNSRRSNLPSPNPFNQDVHPYANNGSLQRSPFVDDLNDVIEQLHRIVNHKRLYSAGRDAPFNQGSSQRTSTDKDLSILHQSIKELRNKLLCSQNLPRDEDHLEY